MPTEADRFKMPRQSPGDGDLEEALTAARTGQRDRAQELAWRSLRQNRHRESAWLLLATLVPTREDQEMCLRQVLAANPGHELAREWFGKVSVAEQADSLRLPMFDTSTVPPPLPRDSGTVPMMPMARVLPLDTRPMPITRLPQEPRREDPREEQPRPRVLVVDDSATVRRLVTLALERLGCEVVTASGGLEALGILSHAAPSLVLLDVGLPNLDGHQICRAIKRNERTSGVPVIMLTGRDGLMDRLRGKMSGASEYLTKPFDPVALNEVVRKYLALPLDEELP
jgi:twitching motility two-component system response regulator PilG